LRGIIVNPVKSGPVVYDDSDRIIVLARS